jgi:hypothetical protein
MRRRGEERREVMIWKSYNPQKQEIIQQMGGAAMIRIDNSNLQFANKSLVCKCPEIWRKAQKYDLF